jgi:hypothetical protein
MIVVSLADCIGVPNNLKLYGLTDVELHRLNAKHIRNRTGRLTMCKSVKSWFHLGQLQRPPAPGLNRQMEQNGSVVVPQDDGKGVFFDVGSSRHATGATP